MNRYSTQLLLAGAMLGTLVLSAAGLARAGAPRSVPTAEPVLLTAQRVDDALWDEPAAAAAAFGSEDRGGPFDVILRLDTVRSPGRLAVCDEAGFPLTLVESDASGEARLGPLMPGKYGLYSDGTCIGSFLLLQTAAVERADGRLWTDGTLLHLTDRPTGEAMLRLELSCPGYYSLYLVDRLGQRTQQDLFIPKDESPDPDGVWRRTMCFRGLQEGVYTAVYAKNPLAQFRVVPGAAAEACLSLERNTR